MNPLRKSLWSSFLLPFSSQNPKAQKGSKRDLDKSWFFFWVFLLFGLSWFKCIVPSFGTRYALLWNKMEWPSMLRTFTCQVAGWQTAKAASLLHAEVTLSQSLQSFTNIQVQKVQMLLCPRTRSESYNQIIKLYQIFLSKESFALKMISLCTVL